MRGSTASFLKAARAALFQSLRHNDAPLHLVHPSGTTAANATDVSFNWSGYADELSKKGSFSTVSANWTVPTVSCPTDEDQISSEWVGLDGATDSTVEQDGTIGQCFEGQAVYYTWYELYPSPTVIEGSTLSPGDQVGASVTRVKTNYTLTVTDTTDGANSFSVTGKCGQSKCKDTSAEWIMERPEFPATGLVPLADFGTWSPTAAAVTASTAGNISSFGPESIDMGDSTGTYNLDTVIPDTGATNGFAVTWGNSY
ncbi:MAG: G1 family glutamic endopeptidase [Acidimicrobiales bacterium]